MGTCYNSLGSNVYSLEVVLTFTQNLCFDQKYHKFLMKFSIFTAEKNLCILHGQVFIYNEGFKQSWGP